MPLFPTASVRFECECKWNFLQLVCDFDCLQLFRKCEEFIVFDLHPPVVTASVLQVPVLVSVP